MSESAFVPVYLPDRTVVGSAVVDLAAGTAVITLQSDSNLAGLIQESLVGLSVVYMDLNAVEEHNNKEKTDGS